MAMVPPEERAAAASVTNVPRSLAAAFAPALGGLLLSHTTFGWPLVLGGGVKVIYDGILLAMFAGLHPEEENVTGKSMARHWTLESRGATCWARFRELSVPTRHKRGKT